MNESLIEHDALLLWLGLKSRRRTLPAREEIPRQGFEVWIGGLATAASVSRSDQGAWAPESTGKVTVETATATVIRAYFARSRGRVLRGNLIGFAQGFSNSASLLVMQANDYAVSPIETKMTHYVHFGEMLAILWGRGTMLWVRDMFAFVQLGGP